MSTRVLVGDEDPYHLRLLEEMCEGAGHRVVSASDGPTLVEIVARERPDLVLVDAQMPRLDGFEVLRILKQDEGMRSIPVLLVTPESDLAARMRAIEMGAEDYVGKPYRVFEVQRRIRNALRAARGDLAATATASVAAPAAPVTPTTSNVRPPFAATLELAIQRAHRNGTPLSLLRVAPVLVDAGHPELEASQRALVESILRSALRSGDPLFRMPDGELVAVLDAADVDGAAVVRRRVAERLADRTLRLGSPGMPAAILGTASLEAGRVVSWSELLAEAAPRSKSHPP